MQRQCEVGKYGNRLVEGILASSRCKNNVRHGDKNFKGSSSICQKHQEKFQNLRKEFLEDKEAYYKKYEDPEPSTQCEGCGDFTMSPGLENFILCSLCQDENVRLTPKHFELFENLGECVVSNIKEENFFIVPEDYKYKTEMNKWSSTSEKYMVYYLNELNTDSIYLGDTECREMFRNGTEHFFSVNGYSDLHNFKVDGEDVEKAEFHVGEKLISVVKPDERGNLDFFGKGNLLHLFSCPMVRTSTKIIIHSERNPVLKSGMFYLHPDIRKKLTDSSDVRQIKQRIQRGIITETGDFSFVNSEIVYEFGKIEVFD